MQSTVFGSDFRSACTHDGHVDVKIIFHVKQFVCGKDSSHWLQNNVLSLVQMCGGKPLHFFLQHAFTERYV